MPPSTHLPASSVVSEKEIERIDTNISGGKKIEKKKQLRGGRQTPSATRVAPLPLNASESSVHAARTSTNDTSTNPFSMMPSSLYSGASLYGGGMYGGSLYGGSMYGMSPLGGGGMLPMGQQGPLSNLNQFFFAVQNVVFSMGQVVQIIGMNTSAIRQLLETASTVLEHALQVYKEMRMLEARASQVESQEEKKRKRRLRALRWMAISCAIFAGYRVVRFAVRRRRPALSYSTLDSGYNDNEIMSRLHSSPLSGNLQ